MALNLSQGEIIGNVTKFSFYIIYIFGQVSIRNKKIFNY